MIKRLLESIVVLSIFFLIVEATAAASYTHGRVSDDQTSLVEGAKVSAFDVNSGAELGSVFTDSDGEYSIDLSQYSKDYVDLRAVKNVKSAEVRAHVNQYEHLHLSNSDQALPIQEFPTVALPVATIVGLMFIISTRKKE